MTAAEASAQYQQTEQAKTAAEQQSQQIYQQVQNYVAQQTQAAQSQTQASAQADPDLWITDPARAQAQLSNQLLSQMQGYVQQAGQPILAGQASLAKSASQNDPQVREVWDRYGAEVEALMSRVPVTNQINKEMWDQAAKLVKSEHIDEIAREKALSLAASLPQTEDGRTVVTTNISEPQSDAIRRIRDSSYGKQKLAHYTDAQLIDTASKMGNTIEEYAQMTEGTNIIIHPDKPNEWRNDDLVRDHDPNR